MIDITDTIQAFAAIYKDDGSMQGVYSSSGEAGRSTVGEDCIIVPLSPAAPVVIQSKETRKKDKNHSWSCDCNGCNLVPVRF